MDGAVELMVQQARRKQGFRRFRLSLYISTFNLFLEEKK
jgi:hypothetical protein